MAPASAWKFEFTAAALIGAARHERVALAVLLSGLGGRTLSADAQSAIEANKAV
jgi:folylpolyglutamate synthase/dihydropteroate synthase